MHMWKSDDKRWHCRNWRNNDSLVNNASIIKYSYGRQTKTESIYENKFQME